METKSYSLLINVAGQLLQQHAFDHLSDEKLGRMNSCLHKLMQPLMAAEKRSVEKELLNYCREVNLFIETATPQSLHQWYAAMSCFGEPVISVLEEAE